MGYKVPVRYYILLAVAALLVVFTLLAGKGFKVPSGPDGPKPGPTKAPAGLPEANGLFALELDDKGNATVMGFLEELAEKLEAGETVENDCFKDGKLLIPAKADGHTVTAIGDSAFSGVAAIKEVRICGNVKTIGEFAFEDCSGITALTLDEGIEFIRESAFYGLSGLTSLVLPSSIKKLSPYCFGDCTALSDITSPVTDGLSDFFEMDALERFTVSDGATSIAEDAFLDCENLKEIRMPDSVKTIAEFAFSGCVSLEKVVLSKNLMSIGENAFEKCESLESIELPEGLSLIAEYAFNSCTALKSANIPASVVTVGRYAFDECEQLTLIVTKDSAGEEYAVKEELKYTVK